MHPPQEPTSQQTPSTQLPSAHEASVTQAAPRPSFAPHWVPPTQRSAASQPAFVPTTQLVAQTVPAQANPPQECGTVVHPPDWHTESLSVPAEQVVAPQEAPFGAEQAPLPLQSARLQLAALAAHVLWTSCPAGTSAHFPTEPATLHALQPAQEPTGVSQQTPSTQLPPWHCESPAQDVPSPSLAGQAVPDAQYAPTGQPAFVPGVQEVAQVFVAQVKPPHEWEAETQAPPWQAESLSSPPEHVGVAQAVPSAATQLPFPSQSACWHPGALAVQVP
jgi:hypothetical protein